MPAEDASGANGSRKFYFMLTFWGEEFRDYFYSLLLPTLLAPDNVPVLKGRPGSKLIVCTTSEDWSALKRRPLMHRLAEHIEPLPLFIGYPESNAAVQLHMSKGHRLAARRAYEDGAVAGFLAPDLLCSDGLVKTAVELVESGKKAVVCPALRFNMEAVLGRVRAAGFLKPDQPAALSPAFMGSVAANGLHPEILRYDFDGKEFDDYPIWTFWRVPQRDGLVLYTVSWALLLADYGALPRYADELLNEGTIDGYYVSRNFGHLRETDQVGFVSDSMQGTFISLTPEKAFRFPSAARLNALFDLFRLGPMKRVFSIRNFHHGEDLDPWRRWLHAMPVVLHGDAIDSTYRQCMARSREIMAAAIDFKGAQDYGRLHALFTSATEFNKRYTLPPLVLFRILIPIVNACTFVNYCFMVCGEVLRGEVGAWHLVRRGLHVMSFGLLFYPATPQRSRFPTLPLPSLAKTRLARAVRSSAARLSSMTARGRKS